MKFALKYLLLLVFWTTTGNFRRLSEGEMMQKLEEFNLTTNEKVKQCLPVLRGDSHPTFADYYYIICAIDNERLSFLNKPNKTLCSNFDCWESQLTETTRIILLNMMNDYRNTVGNGECEECLFEERLVFELTWNKFLEKEAGALLEDCPQNKYSSNIDLSNDLMILGRKETGFAYHSNETGLHKYMLVISFQVPTGTQTEMRTTFRELISENRLQEWDIKNREYKTGLMHEVGCSFVIRRDVNYTTALEEHVILGNVGHLACVYSSFERDTTSPKIKASESNCLNALSIKPTFRGTIYYSNSSFYPYLCKVYPPFIEDASYDICSKRNDDINKYCLEDLKSSPKIWSEKVYGLMLRFETFNRTIEAECILPSKRSPQVIQKYGHAVVYNCTSRHEVVTIANDNKCPNWSCQNSQLTDSSRIQILHYLNEFRNSIAMKNCSEYCPEPCAKCRQSYCDVATLQWHWYLEWQASRTVRDCPSQYKESRTRIFRNTPFPKSTIFEEIILHFEIKSMRELAIDSMMKKLFWQNGFDDWLEDGVTFKRGNALWVGCAFVIRSREKLLQPKNKNVLIHVHLVCIYAALSEFQSSVGSPSNESCCEYCPPTEPCRVKYTKNVFPHTNLCSPIHFEIHMNCEARKELCSRDYNLSEAKTRGYYTDIMIQNLSSPIAYEIRHCANCGDRNPYFKKYCYILSTFTIVVFSVLCFVSSLVFKYKIEENVFIEK